MNALRLVGGVSKDRFTEHTGLPWSDIQPIWQRLYQQGLVADDRCTTTALGLRYLDSVLAEFIV